MKRCKVVFSRKLCVFQNLFFVTIQKFPWRFHQKLTDLTLYDVSVYIIRWVCATIDYPGAFRTAVVNFRYPAFGTIYFRQLTDHDQDTIIWGKLSNMVRTEELGRKFVMWQWQWSLWCDNEQQDRHSILRCFHSCFWLFSITVLTSVVCMQLNMPYGRKWLVQLH